MSSIDERIVQMQFDNNQFESGVKTTLNTLDKLKSSLKLEDAGKGFENVNKSAKELDLNPLISSVETVSNRFSTLGIIGTTALINITNKAIDAGEKLVRSLSIDQVAAGWSKYADKTAAVQTIMAATRETWQDSAKALEFEGTQMEFVNDQLDKLNWFTDETSYNFLDMVNNIGKFTNNGVQLQDAVTSMEGISTWAALSGANITDAGRAMYNFSQAMGSGAMRLQDWKSIENANMATVEFKQAAIDTALELGKLTKAEEDVFKAAEPLRGKGTEFGLATFSQSLKDGWFDTEVMVKTLEKFGGFTDELNRFLESPNIDKYYYSTSRLLDDLEAFNSSDATGQMEILQKASKGTGKSVDELREEFEKLNSSEFDIGRRAFKAAQEAKTFAEAIDSVKDAVSTGWMNTFELIFGNYEEAKVLWTDLANSLYEVFAEGGNVRNDMLQIWRDLGGREALIQGLYSAFASLLRLTEPLSDAFHEVFQVGGDYITKMGWNLTVATAKFRDFAKSIWLTDTAHTNLTNAFKGLFSIIKGVLGVFKTLLSIASVFLKPLNALAGVILAITGRIGELITGAELAAEKSATILDFVAKIREKAQYLADVLTLVIQIVGLLALKFINWAAASIKASGVLEVLRGALYVVVGAFKMALSIVGEFFSKLVSAAGKVIPKIGEMFGKLSEKITNAFPFLGEIKSKIENFVASLAKIKAPSQVFEALQKKISAFGQKANPVLEKVTRRIGNLFTAVKNFAIANAPKAFDALKEAFSGLGNVVVAIGNGMVPVFDAVRNAIGLLVDKIRQLDWGSIASTVQEKASVVANVLVGVGKSVWKFINDFAKAPNKIQFIIEAITKLIDGIKKKIDEIVHDNNLEDLQTKIQNFVNKINESVKGLNPAKVLLFSFGVALTVAVWKIGSAFEKLGEFATSAKDLFGITSLIKKLTNAIKATTTITQIALSIAMIAGSIKLISEIKTEDLIKAGVTIGAVAAGLAGLSFFINKFSAAEFAANAKAIIYIAGAIAILAAALWALSKVSSVDGLLEKAAGLSLVIAAFGAVAIGLNHFAPEFKASAVSILALAGAVLILTKALKDISETIKSENAEQAVETLIALMVSLGALAVAASGIGFGTGFGILGLVGSLVLLDLVLKYLIKFGTTADDALAAIDKIAPVFVALAGMLASTRLAGAHAAQAGVAALLIAGALLLLSKCIEEIKKFSFDDVMQAVLFLGPMALALGGAMMLIGDAGKHGIKAAVSILAITAAVMLLSKCVEQIYNMISANNMDDLLSNILQLSAAVAAISVLALAVGMAAKATEKAKTAPILAMIIGIGLVMAGIALMSQIPDQVAMLTSAVSFAIGLVAFAGAIALASKASEKAKVGPMLAMVVMTIAVAGSLVVLAQLPIGSALAATLSLAAVIAVLAGAADLAKKAADGAKAMAIMAIPLAAAAASLYALSSVNVETFIPSAIALGIIMGAMAGSAKIANDAIKGATSVLIMSVPLVAAAGSLYMLSGINSDNFIPATVAIAGILFSMAGAAKLANDAIKGAAALLLVSLSLVPAAYSLAQLAVFDWQSIGAAAAVLAVTMGVLAGIGVVLGKAGPEAMLAVVAFGAALIEAGYAFELFGEAAILFAEAVDTVVDSFIKLGSMSTEEVDRAKYAIEQFGVAIGTGLANAVTSFVTTIVSSLISGLTQAVTTIVGFVGQFVGAAAQLIGGLISGFLSRAGEFLTTVGKAISDAVAKAGEFVKDFLAKGAEFISNLVQGISGKAGEVKQQFETAIRDALSAIGNFVGEFKSAAENLVAGFISGITSKIDEVTTAASSLASAAAGAVRGALKINSPSKVMIPIGGGVPEGLAVGMLKGRKDLYDAAVTTAKKAEDGTRDALQVHSASPLFKAIGEWIPKSTGDGIKEGAKNLKDTTVKVMSDNVIKPVADTATKAKGYGEKISSALSNSVDIKTGLTDVANMLGADESTWFAFGQQVSEVGTEIATGITNVTQHTSALDSDTAAVNSNTSAKKSASSAAKGYSKATSAASETVKKQVDIMDFAKGAIEAYKEMYGDTMLVLSDTSPTDAAKRAIMGLAEATYYASLKAKDSAGVAKEASEDAQKEIEKIAEAYTKLRDNIANTIENQMDVFKKFEYDGEKITGTKILENMQSNADAAKRFEVDMKRMAEKGFAQPLMEKVAELGPKGIKTIEAFLKMSEEQIERANQLYGQIVELPYQVSDKTIASWAYAGQMAMQGFADGIGNSGEVASNKVFDVATQTLTTLETTLDEHSPSKKTFAMGEFFSQGFIEGIASKANDVIASVSDLGKRTVENLGIFNDKSQAIKLGEDICLGLAEGIKSKTHDVIRAAKDMADAVLEATTDVLEINSPSKAFERIGMYSDEGLARGLRDYSGRVGSAAEALGRGALDNVQSAIEFVKDMLNEGLDDGPTITPVLDLSNVASGAGAIDGLLNGTTLNAAGAIQIQNDRNNLVDAMKDAFSSIMMTDTPNGDITINVYGAQGQDPRAIAEAVEERLLIKFNRLRAARA